jgi:hypothetical protein
MMEFNDRDLCLVLNRALRNVLIATAVGIPVIWIAWGWRSMLMFLVGGAIAATGILEWRRLMTAVLSRLDANSERPKPLGGVLAWFFIRLALAAGLLYVSLRSLDGKVAALLIGLALAVVTLFIEALRIFKDYA